MPWSWEKSAGYVTAQSAAEILRSKQIRRQIANKHNLHTSHKIEKTRETKANPIVNRKHTTNEGKHERSAHTETNPKIPCMYLKLHSPQHTMKHHSQSIHLRDRSAAVRTQCTNLAQAAKNATRTTTEDTQHTSQGVFGACTIESVGPVSSTTHKTSSPL